MTDSLAEELQPFGVHVAAVNPGDFASEMLALNLGHEQSYTREEIAQFIDAMWPYMSGEKSWASPEEEWKFHEDWAERRLPDKD